MRLESDNQIPGMKTSNRSIYSKRPIPLLILLLVLAILPVAPARAEVTCTGTVCTILPADILQQLNQMDKAIQTQYTDKLIRTMTEAAVIANINSTMIGTGVVERFQIGGGITLAGQKKQDIDVGVGSLVFRQLPNVGAAVSPNINLAFNLGWISGHGPADTDIEYSHFLHRFNVYLHGFQYSFNQEDIKDVIKKQDDKIDLTGDISNYGFTIRYHLLPGYSDGMGLFEFSGVSMGVGLHYQKQALSLVYRDNTAQSIAMGSAFGTWGGFPSLDFRSTVTSIPIDVRTGFRLFSFLSLFAGTGTTMNFGNSSLRFQKQGTLSLGITSAAALPGVPPELQALLGGISGNTQTGNLSVTVNGSAGPPNSMSYMIAGVELNFPFLKILVEGVASQNIQSANVGVKLSF